MKTIKVLTAILFGLLFSVVVVANTEVGSETDTIRIKTKEGSEMIIVINKFSELKDLEKDISVIFESLDEAFEKIEAFDTVFQMSVDNLEQKIIIEGSKDGSSSKIDIKMDAPAIERKPKNLHVFSSFSIGLNNYLENGKFPNDNKEQYSVKNWGSWDVSIGTGIRWYVAKPLSFDISGDVSWYNFKFQDRATRLDLTNNQVGFFQDNLGYEYQKSKLTVPYINASIIPMIHFGKKSSGLNRNMFRFGAGVYGGYRIGGKIKYVFENNNNRTVYKERDDFYLSSYRYGVKAIFGFEEFNIYASYDLNTLFAENKAPELNPISFGFNFNF
jgi:hypothetical protein